MTVVSDNYELPNSKKTFTRVPGSPLRERELGEQKRHFAPTENNVVGDLELQPDRHPHGFGGGAGSPGGAAGRPRRAGKRHEGKVYTRNRSASPASPGGSPRPRVDLPEHVLKKSVNIDYETGRSELGSGERIQILFILEYNVDAPT